MSDKFTILEEIESENKTEKASMQISDFKLYHSVESIESWRVSVVEKTLLVKLILFGVLKVTPIQLIVYAI